MPEALEELWRECDHDKSGRLELREFEDALRLLRERHGFEKAEAEEFLKLFERFDHDQSEEICVEEILRATGYMGWPFTMSTRQAALDFVNLFDMDGNGTISKHEWLQAMQVKRNDELQKMQALFAEHDVDQSGTVDGDEAMKIFMALGYSVPT